MPLCHKRAKFQHRMRNKAGFRSRNTLSASRMGHIPDATDNGSFTPHRPRSTPQRFEAGELTTTRPSSATRRSTGCGTRCGAPCCPDGNPQRVCHPLGFRERNVGELELRVALGGNDGGMCQVIGTNRGGGLRASTRLAPRRGLRSRGAPSQLQRFASSGLTRAAARRASSN